MASAARTRSAGGLGVVRRAPTDDGGRRSFLKAGGGAPSPHRGGRKNAVNGVGPLAGGGGGNPPPPARAMGGVDEDPASQRKSGQKSEPPVGDQIPGGQK